MQTPVQTDMLSFNVIEDPWNQNKDIWPIVASESEKAPQTAGPITAGAGLF